MYENIRRFAVTAGIVAVVASGGIHGSEKGVGEGKFAPCPTSPNCVSSEAVSETHYIEPFTLAVNGTEGWQAIRQAVTNLPRTRIVAATNNYIHAECRSRLFRFVDDLELRLSDADGVVAVRSASRIGYGDLGANRKRVERLRQDLAGRGLID